MSNGHRRVLCTHQPRFVLHQDTQYDILGGYYNTVVRHPDGPNRGQSGRITLVVSRCPVLSTGIKIRKSYLSPAISGAQIWAMAT